MRLSGKVAVVTGGASGMGAATVRRFRREGAEVVLTDVQDTLGEAVAAETGATFIRHDVTDEAGWTRVMGLVEEKFGRLDVVMNNAGILGRGSIEDVVLDDWNRVIAVNLTGVMLGCRHGLAVMRRNPDGASGSLINVSSIGGMAGMATDAAYSASKGGVRLLSKSIAVHCARAGYRIRSNSIHPGVVDTPMLQPGRDVVSAEMFDQMVRGLSPSGRLGVGEDIAGLAAYLASNDSQFVNGAELVIDGGGMAGVPGC